MKRFQFLLALCAAIVGLLLATRPADAGFRLRVEDLGAGVGIVVTDGGANDLVPLTDVVMFTGSVGSFSFTVQVGTATPNIPFAGFFDAMDLNCVIVTNNPTGGTSRMILEKDGFTAGPDGGVALEGRIGAVMNAVTGTTVSFQSWSNAANLMPDLGPDTGPLAGALGAVGGMPPTGSTEVFGGAGVTFTPGAFSTAQSVPFNKSGTYALFSSATVTFTGPGSVGFDHTTGTNPAPGGLLLLAAGIPCLVAGYFRRQKAGQSPCGSANRC